MNSNVDLRPIDFQNAKQNIEFELGMLNAFKKYLTDEEKGCFFIQKKLLITIIV